MPVRGIRGAVQADANTPEAILGATQTLLQAILDANPELQTEEIAAAMFTVTQDLEAAFPAQAARRLGWNEVPLLCFQEIPVPGSLGRCIRVLLLWNTALPQNSIHPVYLGAAARLRPELSETETF